MGHHLPASRIQGKLLALKAATVKFEDFVSSMANGKRNGESNCFSKDGSPNRLAQPALPLEEEDEIL